MAGLSRCPSVNGPTFSRAASIPSPRRASSLAAAGRRSSLECSAALRPEPFEPNHGYDALDALTWASSPQPAQPVDDPSVQYFHSSQHLNRMFAQPSAPAEPAEAMAPRDGTCHVILFGVGEEMTEGIYTLRTQDYVEGDYANVDTVVAFEAAVDAERFATLLEASLGHEPTVFPIAWADITEWCGENNTRCRLEPAGSLILPPASNLGVTDWERLLSLRRNEFQVLDAEPALGEPSPNYGLASGFFIDGDDWVFQEEPLAAPDHLGNIVDSRLADTPMPVIRQELERMMSQ